VLDDDPAAWPLGRGLTLEGFSFQGLSIPPDMTPSWRDRLPAWVRRRTGEQAWLDRRFEWLRCQADDRWSPYPYGQLAAALGQAGHETASRDVAIERERQRTRRGGLDRPSRLARRLLGAVVGYGYRPGFALLWAALVIAVGGLAFHRLHERDFTHKPNPPTYHSLAYSLDAFLPIVNLHQEEARVPRALGWNVYLWIHIGLGWVLTTLGIAGVTGIVRRE
jgi:hypothetical protein